MLIVRVLYQHVDGVLSELGGPPHWLRHLRPLPQEGNQLI